MTSFPPLLIGRQVYPLPLVGEGWVRVKSKENGKESKRTPS
jgi:hypothetical protein